MANRIIGIIVEKEKPKSGCGGFVVLAVVGLIVWAVVSSQSPSSQDSANARDLAQLQQDIDRSRSQPLTPTKPVTPTAPKPTSAQPVGAPPTLPKATTSDSLLGPDPNSPALPSEDLGVVDTRGGWEWSDRCFRNIQRGRLQDARAECMMGINLPAESPRPMSALLYNVGLIEEAEGNLGRAAEMFRRSLKLFDHNDTRLALAQVTRP